ncbi:hypothetical protein L1987_44295 [Smallanthus sonchifolius]|uniref:Uncharacterized protein n=1 Tax=Smallanthus sonchifolius TaxID=185202 RepID=A0ACB9GP20_9ASTR|nr:hypothetical protein L1987_44295 [Smallanthus sonchifolius]
MSSAIVRSSLRAALRGGSHANPASKRPFSSGSSADEEAREAAKLEKITYVGIAACSILAFVNFIMKKNIAFAIGPDGLFEVKEHH